jgi:hypothetical protein
VTVEAPCSVGDLLDRITILRIKVRRCAPEQSANVAGELGALARLWATEEPEMAELARVNEALWEVEDRLRVAEAAGSFGDAFIADARSVYRLNDRRAALKRALNLRLGSTLIEEKVHPDYAAGPASGPTEAR